jgi:hypothetical protein
VAEMRAGSPPHLLMVRAPVGQSPGHPFDDLGLGSAADDAYDAAHELDRRGEI